MSLDVYLNAKDVQDISGDHIFIRENGSIAEISREEWDQRYPGRQPFVVSAWPDTCVFSYNITHNLGEMALEAGIYQHLWRPEELSITQANQLILPLTFGLDLLRSDPERFKKLNPPNGWGNYEALVKFVEAYLQACKDNPDATISVSR
jgi:hypothetical protein